MLAALKCCARTTWITGLALCLVTGARGQEQEGQFGFQGQQEGQFGFQGQFEGEQDDGQGGFQGQQQNGQGGIQGQNGLQAQARQRVVRQAMQNQAMQVRAMQVRTATMRRQQYGLALQIQARQQAQRQ